MISNDILRRVRYIFRIDDLNALKLFQMGGELVNRKNLQQWLTRDEDEDFVRCPDVKLAAFLNGLIEELRGPRDGGQPKAETRLNNNLILRKLRIACDYRDEDMLEVLALAEFEISKPELNALFRKPGHRHFRECRDQLMRNFLKGLQLKKRPTAPSADVWAESKSAEDSEDS